jgi:hypothetical protein
VPDWLSGFMLLNCKKKSTGVDWLGIRMIEGCGDADKGGDVDSDSVISSAAGLR